MAPLRFAAHLVLNRLICREEYGRGEAPFQSLRIAALSIPDASKDQGHEIEPQSAACCCLKRFSGFVQPLVLLK